MSPERPNREKEERGGGQEGMLKREELATSRPPRSHFLTPLLKIQ